MLGRFRGPRSVWAAATVGEIADIARMAGMINFISGEKGSKGPMKNYSKGYIQIR